MGNAAVTIHHPTSLEHEVSYLEAGKMVNSTTSLIRLEKSEGAAVGCGGRIVFKQNMASSEWTYRVTKQISNFEVGQEITVQASSNAEANNKIAAKFGMSWSQVGESVTIYKFVIPDTSFSSELYCYVDYNGKNNGTYIWTKNDLDLKATHRWAEDSEMIINVVF